MIKIRKDVLGIHKRWGIENNILIMSEKSLMDYVIMLDDLKGEKVDCVGCSSGGYTIRNPRDGKYYLLLDSMVEITTSQIIQ